VIGTLDEAWRWYNAARDLSRVMARLGGKYWNTLPWDGSLGRDNALGQLQSDQVKEMSRVVLDDLDDLCVLLLFSVCEATVRERVLADVTDEMPPVRHPALIQALEALNDTISHGSFYRVMDPYKGLNANLVEEVNQVRRYRNWVAHGRRTEQPNYVSPDVAYQRLGRFLDRLASPGPPRGDSPPEN
jgi:hypothetical protein